VYEAGSFSGWLQNTALKEDKTVYLYDGRKKGMCGFLAKQLNKVAYFEDIEMGM
jgi:hypothetical protein